MTRSRAVEPTDIDSYNGASLHIVQLADCLESIFVDHPREVAD